MICNYT